ncbi:hypothetical protein [Paraburkholderia caffeinilytica]|uniref:hypothetical protein n=1 Tax=Paraburkholderia caffeinilytica TaxID=1761016 RepID=UPI0013BE8D9E|nr:hypothetical protein [Paraburkholderia caffeinilytica]
MVILQIGVPILANPALPTGAIALFCAAFAQSARNLAAAVAAGVPGAARSFGDRGFRGNVISSIEVNEDEQRYQSTRGADSRQQLPNRIL